jgi:hypothetical protein
MPGYINSRMWTSHACAFVYVLKIDSRLFARITEEVL